MKLGVTAGAGESAGFAGYLDRLTGSYSGPEETAIEDWFTAVDASPGLDAFDAVYFRFMDNTADARQNVLGPSYHSFVAGTCPFTAGQGFASDGVNGSHVDCNFDPSRQVAHSKFQLDSAHRFSWVKTNATNKALFGALSSQFTAFYPSFSPGNRFVRCNNSTDFSTATTDASGMWTITRTLSTEYRIYRNATLLDTVTATSTFVDSSNFCDLASAGGNGFTDISFMSGFGRGLTTGEQGDLYAANLAVLQAFGVVA